MAYFYFPFNTMKRLKHLILILAIFCSGFSAAAANDADSSKINYVLSLNPIFAIAAFNTPTTGTTLIGLELGANPRFGLNLFNDYYRVGVETKVYWATGEGQIPNWYYFAGIYNQFNFRPKKRNRLYVEAGLQLSNLCQCTVGTYTIETSQRKGMFYYGIGGGWDIYLSKRFDITLGVMHYRAFNKLPLKYPWTQSMLVGVDYYFKDRYKPKKARKVQIP